MSSSTPVTAYVLTKEKHTLVYMVLGTISIPLTQFDINNFNY